MTVAFWIKKEAEQLRNNFLQGASIDRHDDIVSHQFINPDSEIPELQLTADEQKEIDEIITAKPCNALN